MKKLITGNEAVAYGALTAGVKVAAGYPGTPSTGALTCLLDMDLKEPHVEWSTNEKVAFEVATGVSWAGHRALCTMKMSGVNVAADSLLAVAYSGCEGGLVLYVADDPGVSAGCVEQDTRLYAKMANLPVLEPASVAETYTLTVKAFELSEKIKAPVILRLVTAIASSFAEVEVEDPVPVSQAEPVLIRDIARFTKAGAQICMTQHRDSIQRLAKAGQLIHEWGLNRLALSTQPGGLGIIASGITAAYLDEAFELASRYGLKQENVSVLQVVGTHPFPVEEARALMDHCSALLVLEELEPHLEEELVIEARKRGYSGSIIGKMDGTFSVIGEYGLAQVIKGLSAALGLKIPDEVIHKDSSAETLAAARPITVCAGCPHRGSYMAINQAIKKLKYKPDQVMVTGDIGCTILGMNPPFNTAWTEISMGASIGLAQGYVYAGVKTPVIATMGDSTFFHAGIPGLVNAIQHNTNLTLVILDNGWTAMTGMQVNPNTADCYQVPGGQQVDIAKIIPALGVENFFQIDPFDQKTSVAVLMQAMQLPGVKVVLSRRECAIQHGRRVKKTQRVVVIEENCNLCKLCLMVTGCSALEVGEKTILIDGAQCQVCGLCVDACNRDALRVEEIR